jgi:serine/threonine-protein kinase
MAPELLIGGMPSAKADLYSIGVVLHECLIGTTPFGSRSPIEVLGSKLGSLTPRAAASMASEHEPVSESRRSERSPLPVRTPGAAPRPSELLSLVQYMIHPDPDRRLGVATEALAAWVRVGHLSGVLR